MHNTFITAGLASTVDGPDRDLCPTCAIMLRATVWWERAAVPLNTIVSYDNACPRV